MGKGIVGEGGMGRGFLGGGGGYRHCRRGKSGQGRSL